MRDAARLLGFARLTDRVVQRVASGVRLAAQREDYLLKTLRGYKDNTRRGYDAQMSEVVYDLKDEDFVELAYFLARQK